MVSLRTLDELRLVGTPHALQEAVVEGLGQLRGHGRVEVGLVALQDALQGELTDAQHLETPVRHTFTPGAAVLVVEETQIEDFAHSEKKGTRWRALSDART